MANVEEEPAGGMNLGGGGGGDKGRGRREKGRRGGMITSMKGGVPVISLEFLSHSHSNVLGGDTRGEGLLIQHLQYPRVLRGEESE